MVGNYISFSYLGNTYKIQKKKYYTYFDTVGPIKLLNIKMTFKQSFVHLMLL